MKLWIYSLIILAISSHINTSIPKPRIFIYKEVAHVGITLNVYIPQKSSYASLPIIFMVHGGIHVTGNKTLEIQSPRVFREFMNRGWCVITMDYRLGPYGLVFDILDDLVDAYAFVRTHLVDKFSIDINNIHLYGQSTAGTLVLLCGRLFEPRPKSIVAMYPLTDYVTKYVYVNPLKGDPLFLYLNSRLSRHLTIESPVLASLINNPRIITNPDEYSLTPRLRYSVFYLTNTSNYWAHVTHNVFTNESTIRLRLAAMSPFTQVDDTLPPIYCAHGMNDTGVNYMDTVAFVKILQLHHIPYVLHLAPGLPHSFDTEEVIDSIWYPHVLPAFDFLQKYIDENTEISS